ncbi:hypothetical protein [Flocculibacter collagenilyticus]|uniref:hypothetical protein n=1 Tax=Flocculibacter collagenilyticus TaxID=2744479 RepID=UPI0018F39348|nr:hypothetical protein [Flocculibacter collagenilyticus]
MMWLKLIVASILCLPLSLIAQNFSDAEITLIMQRYKDNNQSVQPHAHGVAHTGSHQPHKIDKETVRYQLLENQFLLAEAKRLSPKILIRQTSVGFTNAYHVRRYVLDLLNAANIKVTATPPSAQAINTTLGLSTSKQLTTLLGAYPHAGSLSHPIETKLKHIELAPLITRAPHETRLSLFDIYDSLSMQSRFRLHQGDLSLLQNEIIKRHRYQQVTQAAQKKLKMLNISLTNLEVIALGDILRPTMLGMLGVTHVMHGESPILETLEQQVSAAQIQQYYARHKEEFRYIDNIAAHAIIFDKRSEAVEFQQHAKSTNIADAFKHKTASSNLHDMFAPYNNRLTRAHHQDWAASVVFTLPEHTLSQPMRTPSGKWLVAYTGDKQLKYFAANHETVTYQAKKEVAKHLAKTQYSNRLNQWLKNNQA